MMKKVLLAVLLVLLLAAGAVAAVNINTASKEELNALPGIGPVKAEAIIKYRQEHGPFKSIDELKNVYGIGDKLFGRLKGDIIVDGPAAAAAPVKTEVKAAAETTAETPAAAQPEKKAEKKPAEKKNEPASSAASAPKKK